MELGWQQTAPPGGCSPTAAPVQLRGLGQGTVTCQGCPQRAEHPGQVLTRDQHPRVAPAPAQGAGCAALLGSLLGIPYFGSSARFLDVLCQFKKDLNFIKVKHHEAETRGVAGYIKMVLICL